MVRLPTEDSRKAFFCRFRKFLLCMTANKRLASARMPSRTNIIMKIDVFMVDEPIFPVPVGRMQVLGADDTK